MSVKNETNFQPPPYPPPMLSVEQLCHLAERGYLQLDLAPELKALYDELFQTASKFFDSSKDEKSQRYPQSHGTEKGYYHISDEKEYVTLRCANHTDSDLERIAEKVWQATATMLHRILVGLSEGLDVPPAAWNPILENSLSLPSSMQEHTKTLLRMFRYAPTSGTAEPHTDSGLLTLCVGSGKGLQVFSKNNSGGDEWHWKDTESPTLLVGSTLQGLSFRRVHAGLHRVVGNPEGRSSIVFTLRPSTRNQLDLIPFGGEGIISMKNLWEEITGSKYNVNAHQYIRDMQKEKQRKAASSKSNRIAQWKDRLKIN